MTEVRSIRVRYPDSGVLFLAVWFVLAGLAGVATARPIVALTTDFGLNNEAVGLCHGAILAIDSEIAVVDLQHTIRPFDVRQASLALKRTEVFPSGTVFVTVVDPGVGTKRGAVAIRTRLGHIHVAPDNGVLTEVMAREGVAQAVRIDAKRVNSRWRLGTFDGRDLFSPAGAILASRGGKLQLIGQALSIGELVRLPALVAAVERGNGSIRGHFLRSDEPYGNAWTDIGVRDLSAAGIQLGDRLSLEFNGSRLELPFVTTFGEVPQGKPLAYVGSDETLAFALNLGNFVQAHQWREGLEIRVTRLADVAGAKGPSAGVAGASAGQVKPTVKHRP